MESCAKTKPSPVVHVVAAVKRIKTLAPDTAEASGSRARGAERARSERSPLAQRGGYGGACGAIVLGGAAEAALWPWVMMRGASLPSSKVATVCAICPRDREIRWVQAGNVVAFGVGDGDVELHHVDDFANDRVVPPMCLAMRLEPPSTARIRREGSEPQGETERAVLPCFAMGHLVREVRCISPGGIKNCREFFREAGRSKDSGALPFAGRNASLPPRNSSPVSRMARSMASQSSGMRGEDLFDHAPRQFGNHAVERQRAIAHLVGQPRPVQIVGLPGLGQHAARIAQESGRGRHDQQFANIALRQNGMRNAEILRQPLPTDFCRITVGEGGQFFSCRPQLPLSFGKCLRNWAVRNRLSAGVISATASFGSPCAEGASICSARCGSILSLRMPITVWRTLSSFAAAETSSSPAF